MRSDARKRLYEHSEVRSILEDEIAGLYHPEFGTEWRDPDGSLWQHVQQARAEAWFEGWKAGVSDTNNFDPWAEENATTPNPYRGE